MRDPVTSTSRELVQRLNRGVKGRHAKLSTAGIVPFGPSLEARRYRLGNGLTVLMMNDRGAPVISYQTWFRVGSRHEKKGKTGLAHLFEHMMFNESENLPAGEFDRLLEDAGAESNAATWTDWTHYYENLPAAELELAMRLESERMQHLILRDPQIASEKDVVANERRTRVDDDIEGSAGELLYATAYKKHPYRCPTIGWMRDILAFTTADCQAFYRTYYAPNNANIVLVGDFDEEEALAMLQKHYGHIPSVRIPAEIPIREPAQKAERRATLTRPTAAEKILVGYHAPAFADPAWAHLALVNEILFGGRSSRVYRRLVTDDEIASEVRASLTPFAHPGIYELWANAREGHCAAELLAVVDEEFDGLLRHGVTEADLDKAKNRVELGSLLSMETASGKANDLGFHETVTGDASHVFARLREYREATVDDLRAVVHRYLRNTARTVVTVTVPRRKKASRKSATGRAAGVKRGGSR